MPQVLRATLDAVMASQERLRLHLDELIANNRGIETEVERAELFKELSYATLGFGSDVIIRFPSPSCSGSSLLKKDIETVLRWLSYEKYTTVEVPDVLFGTTTAKYPVEIRALWAFLRNNLFSVYPLALKAAASMSKEQEGTKKAAGYDIEGKNDIQ